MAYYFTRIQEDVFWFMKIDQRKRYWSDIVLPSKREDIKKVFEQLY